MPDLTVGAPPLDARIVVVQLAVGVANVGQVIVAVSKDPSPRDPDVRRVWVGSPLFLGELGKRGLTGELLKGTPSAMLEMFDRVARELAKPPASVIIPPW